VTLGSLQRRALINGGIATAVTLAIGMGVVAAVTGPDSEPPPPTPSPTPTTPPPPACTPSWEIAQSADPGALSNWLSAITIVNESEAWAVGGSGDPATPLSVLIERWDGIAWTAEQGPAPGSQINELRAVDTANPNDVWAAGRTASGFGDRPVVLRFDGTEWLDVELPSEVTGVLDGIVATDTNDVWAVGYTGDPAASLEHALILHWDGQLWAVVDAGRAVGLGRSALLDVEALAPDDVWAVGYLHNHPLIVHYDGSEWSRSETEIDGATNAVQPITPTDAWAAGAPIQHFDGQTWTQASAVRSEGELFGIAAVSPSDVWAVGSIALSQGDTKSVVLRFDGQEWVAVEGPAVAGSDALTAIDALPDGTVLAVGHKDVEAGRRTLAVLGTTCPPPS
jgi:hypothetical protein